MKNFIIAIAVLFNLLWLFTAWVRPFIYVKKTGHFLRGVAMCWFYGVFIAVIISLVIPSFLMFLLPSHKDLILNSFPRSICITPWLMLGWLQGAIVCGIANIFYKPPNPYLNPDCQPPDNHKDG